MRTVLVTGFEPFGGDTRNPSADVALALDGRSIAGAFVHGRVLPCVFGESLVALRRLITDTRPAAIVCLGVAGDRDAITPERIAINLDDARIPDNAGAQPRGQRVVPDGPAARRSTLPVEAIVSELRTRGLPAEISDSAGAFVCNHVFYALMHDLRDVPQTRGGFIHIPFASAALPLGSMTDAVAAAVETTLRAG